MERKIEIPEMDCSELLRLAKGIRPIVYFKHSTPVYLRPLEDFELIYAAYTWLNHPSDYGAKVDYSKLSILADVKMIHTYVKFHMVQPTVGEVIRQIPKSLLERTVAFEIIYCPKSFSDFRTFASEFKAGYHVSVVRLYQDKDNNNVPATQPDDFWPTKTSPLPIGMSESTFKWLRRL